MNEGIVLTKIDDRGIAEVTLNRPERNNAYNGEMISELIKSFTSLYKNNDVRIVLIRGLGKHFQGGADLEWLKEIGKLNEQENIEVSRNTASAIKGLTEFPKPTIAMIHGGCFGGGTGIAAAADIVIASEDAIFSIAEAKCERGNEGSCRSCASSSATRFLYASNAASICKVAPYK